MAMSMFIGILFVTPMVLLTPSLGFQFYVGGRDGWVSKPSEYYNHWSHRNRFQVNDTLYFKYHKGSDSVLEVTKDDYDSCNNRSPTQAMNDGNTFVTLARSGPYYFISGNMENCQKGQKLFLVVMAVRPREPPIHPPVSPVTPPISSLVPISPQTTTPKAPSPAPSVSSSPTPGPSPTRISAPVPAPIENTASASSGLAVAALSLFFVGFMQQFGLA